ncbi:MAG: ATP-binding protein [Bacteroidales bacterium]|nr:ATP-binding protein [Bacteroidales bacterium]
MVLNEFIEKQIVGRLKIDNPWWESHSIRNDYRSLTPRAYLDIFYNLVRNTEVRRSVILMGPRRVGKTVMLYHTIQRLINEGVSSKNIIYISVETPIYNGVLLEHLMRLSMEAMGRALSTTVHYYVFFDEVQYLKDWEINLKSLTDTYPNIKFVASGSAAAALKKSSIESGAGRFTDFNLPPLTFYEYILLHKQESLLKESIIKWNHQTVHTFEASDIQQLNDSFIDYINYGGYPEVAFNTAIQADPGQYIRHDIIDKVLLRDLPSLYGISDVQELNSLFTVIAYHSGNEFSYESLSKNSGVKKETLRKYLQYLEAAFLLKIIHRTDNNAKRYQRESCFKIYLTNPSLRCALFQPITPSDNEIGNMVETAVYAQWIPRIGSNISYAHWSEGRKEKGEVDIVGVNPAKQTPDWAVEVKWTDRYYKDPNELTSLKSYMITNHLLQALVTTMTESGLQSQPWGNLQFMPTACYAYIVGKNTLNRTKEMMGM